MTSSMKRLFHETMRQDGLLSRLPPLTLRPTSASLRARGAQDESTGLGARCRGRAEKYREMDFNIPEDSGVKFRI